MLVQQLGAPVPAWPLLVLAGAHAAVDPFYGVVSLAVAVLASLAGSLPWFWAGRRFVDFLANTPHVHGRTEVLGPFPPPERDDQIDAAIEGWRQAMLEQLSRMRQAEPARG